MRPFSDPSNVSSEHGEVIMDGPDGVAVSLTPDAALETAERLFEVAVQATGEELGKKALADERQSLGLPPRQDTGGD
jgi:hypothetical protein